LGHEVGPGLIAALPREPLRRLRLLLLAVVVGLSAQLLFRVAHVPAASPAQRGAAYVAVALLCAWWIYGYRAQRLAWPLLPVEGLALIALSAPLGGPLGVLAYLSLACAYRALYGASLRGLAPILTYCLAFAAGCALAPAYASAPDYSYLPVQTPFLPIMGLVMWLMAEGLRRQEAAFASQRQVNETGAQLVVQGDRQDIIEAACIGLRRLLGGRGVRIVGNSQIADIVSDGLRLPLTGHGGVQAVLLVDGLEPLPEDVQQPLEALCTLIALRLEAFEESQNRQRRAELRAEELAELNDFKDELMNSVSHELRSPLTSIRAYSELLLTYQDAAVQREFLEIINFESERLARLVSDVLDLTTIQSGSFEWHMAAIDVPALLNDAARIYRPLIAREGLEFDVGAEDGLPAVNGDRDRLLQVIGNLLHNALKFTIRGSVGLAAYHAGREVHIAVSDSGVGVPPAERERIFDKFHQAGRAPSGKAPGTGLGLAICRQIVEHHGGRIWVTPAPRGGSVFTFALPALPEAAPRPDAPAAGRAPSAPRAPAAPL
jgi:signal transduction histidine kinase